MWEVVYTLLPVWAMAVFYFGLSAVLVTLSAVAGCLLTEWVFTPEERRNKAVTDGSALITGMLLALTLPRAFPVDGLCWRGNSYRNGEDYLGWRGPEYL
jgi:electron transport complex protein RnfD